QVLFSPIASKLQKEWKGKRLAIVASGALQYVPFAALPMPESGKTAEPARRRARNNNTRRQARQSAIRNSQSALPLIVNHQVVNLPSASALALIRRGVPVRGAGMKTLAMFADPVFDVNDPRLVTLRKKRAGASGVGVRVRSAGDSSGSSEIDAELTRSAE